MTGRHLPGGVRILLIVALVGCGGDKIPDRLEASRDVVGDVAPEVEVVDASEVGASEVDVGEPALSLVLARDHLEDAFLVPGSVWADEARIYLAGYSGTLYALARDRAQGFPLSETLPLSTAPLSAVRGDATRLFVTARDGMLHVFARADMLTAIDAVSISPYGVGDLVVSDAAIFVTSGSAHIAADDRHVFVARLNEGDEGFALDPTSLAITRTFAGPFEPGMTVVYARADGARVAAIGWPTDVRGEVAFPVLTRLTHALAQNVAGCCGTGLDLYDPLTFEPLPRLDIAWVNAVGERPAASGGAAELLIGTELGHVLRVDQTGAIVGDVDLRAETQHLGAEDIEIRALHADGLDDLVFAGSSWGNDDSRGPLLPSFFVLAAPRSGTTR